jgi:hypothetical protein
MGHDHEQEHSHEHSHGGVTHSHVPAKGAAITWRSLFVLGLAGGIIPSTSALLILLGAIASGRPAFGIVLVVAFGIGMALVMTGIGLLVVGARGRLDRLGSGPGSAPFGPGCRWAPRASCLDLACSSPPRRSARRPRCRNRRPCSARLRARMRDFTDRALDTAVSLGAGYADARVVRRLSESISIKSGRVEGVASGETEGFGVRVLVDGAWGFASSHVLTAAEADRVGGEAVRIARASATALRNPVVLDDRPAASGTYETPVGRIRSRSRSRPRSPTCSPPMRPLPESRASPLPSPSMAPSANGRRSPQAMAASRNRPSRTSGRASKRMPSGR